VLRVSPAREIVEGIGGDVCARRTAWERPHTRRSVGPPGGGFPPSLTLSAVSLSADQMARTARRHAILFLMTTRMDHDLERL
jgi:hypothetical protein